MKFAIIRNFGCYTTNCTPPRIVFTTENYSEAEKELERLKSESFIPEAFSIYSKSDNPNSTQSK